MNKLIKIIDYINCKLGFHDSTCVVDPIMAKQGIYSWFVCICHKCGKVYLSWPRG